MRTTRTRTLYFNKYQNGKLNTGAPAQASLKATGARRADDRPTGDKFQVEAHSMGWSAADYKNFLDFFDPHVYSCLTNFVWTKVSEGFGSSRFPC